MPGKPKEKGKAEKEKPEKGDDSSWSEDQNEREYYYDDSHGYEVFDPDKDLEEDEQG